MIDLRFRFWDSIAKDWRNSKDYSVTSGGDSVYIGAAYDTQIERVVIPVQSTTMTAPCGREIWFGDIYYNAGYGDLHIKTMGDILLLIEGLAENDIGAYIGNIYQNPELIENNN